MITNYFKGNINKRLFGIESVTMPNSYYMSSSSTAINVLGEGATEVGLRTEIPNNKTIFTNSLDQQITLKKEIVSDTFDNTVVPSNTNVDYFAMYDTAAIGTGNMLIFDELRETQLIQPDSNIKLEVGTNIFMLENCPSSKGKLTYFALDNINNLIYGNSITSTNANGNVPTSFRLGLSTTPIFMDGTGVTTPLFSGYAPIIIENNNMIWGLDSSNDVYNLDKLTFNTSLSEDSNTVKYIYLEDFNGNIWYYAELLQYRTISTGTTLIVPSGSIKIKMNSCD